MKTLFIAYTEITVYGVSWDSADDAIENAFDWWESEREKPADIDEIKTMSLDLPDTATDDDFKSCADVREYEAVAETLNDQTY